jgi:hypothetical protein
MSVESKPERFVLPAAMQSPLTATVPRRAGSVRRTSHVDMTITPTGLLLTGAARDLLTAAGDATVLGEATVSAALNERDELRTITTAPVRPELAALDGLLVGRGFRTALHHALPAEMAACTPLALVLDELPVAAMIAKYVNLYDGSPIETGNSGVVRLDICSGFRHDGTMLVGLRERGRIPAPHGPPAPELTHTDDPLAWHHLGPLTPVSMRRRRLLDVTPGRDGAPHAVYAMFRDTAMFDDGEETVLHEYALVASVDPATATLIECNALPRVLPWVECPVAGASAWRLNGRKVADIRDFVRDEFRGVSTCTHLNDLLRSLGDIDVLLTAAR